jgi:hypothetical protein
VRRECLDRLLILGAYANGRLKHTKTPLSTRAVPLQVMALDALHRLPPSKNPILFPNSRGGRIDFRSFGRRHWKPAQMKAGIEPLRHLYDLRHTYATFALRAGVSVFACGVPNSDRPDEYLRFAGLNRVCVWHAVDPVAVLPSANGQGPVCKESCL